MILTRNVHKLRLVSRLCLIIALTRKASVSSVLESSGQKNRPQASKVTPRSSDRSGSTAGKSNRSSMESGEHRSDEEEGESREHEKGKKRSLVRLDSMKLLQALVSVEKEKKTKYSKFESSSSESDSESEADQDNYQRDHATDESDIDEGAGDNGKGGAETAAAETETAIDPMDLDGKNLQCF